MAPSNTGFDREGIGMKIRTLEPQEALEKGIQLPFAMLRFLSKVFLGETPKQTDLSELLEARFFNQEKEIRIFQRDGILCAAYLEQEENDNPIKKTYVLENPNFGTQITVSYDLSYDSDGQAYISSMRLSDWEGKKKNG